MRAIGTGSATCWLRLASAAGPLLVGYLVARGTGAVFLMFAAAGMVGAVAGSANARDAQPPAGRDRAVSDTPGLPIAVRVRD